MSIFLLVLSSEMDLRFFEEENAELLSALVDSNREELNKWFPWVEETQHSGDTLGFIRESQSQFEAGQSLQLGIWYRGELAGVIGLKDINKNNNKTTEIGYWLDVKLWGRGLMTAACRGLVDHAFSEMGLNRVEIRCEARNRRSQRIPERLGFVREGVLRQAEHLRGEFRDMVLFSMLARDWKQDVE